MFHHDNNNLPQNQKLFHNMLKRLNDHLINSNINLFLYIHHYYIIHIKDFDLPQSVWRDRRMFYHQVFRRGRNTHMVHLLQQIRLLMQDLLFFVANLLQIIYSLHPNLNLAVLKFYVYLKLDLLLHLNLICLSLNNQFFSQLHILLESPVLLC